MADQVNAMTPREGLRMMRDALSLMTATLGNITCGSDMGCDRPVDMDDDERADEIAGLAGGECDQCAEWIKTYKAGIAALDAADAALADASRCSCGQTTSFQNGNGIWVWPKGHSNYWLSPAGGHSEDCRPEQRSEQ
jgi:hypothetical protein